MGDLALTGERARMGDRVRVPDLSREMAALAISSVGGAGGGGAASSGATRSTISTYGEGQNDRYEMLMIMVTVIAREIEDMTK